MNARVAGSALLMLLLVGCTVDGRIAPADEPLVEGQIALPVDSFGGVGDELWSHDSTFYGSQYGWSVAVVGDIDGDGYEDVAVGCRKCSDPQSQSQEGLVEVFYGSASGPSSTADHTFQNNENWALMGSSVDGADLNGDGYVELVVGIPDWGGGTGAVFIYEGSATGLPSSPTVTLTAPTSDMDFGYDLAGAGDLDGDGLGDLAVGAPIETGTGGAVYVWYGDTTLTSLPAAPDWTYDPSGSTDLGWSVAAAGDVNGDGYGDLAFGDADKAYIGMAYVFHGSFSGLGSAPDWTATPPTPGGGSNFGGAVAGVGDVDGDGYADVVVSAPDWGDDGRIWLYYGSASGLGTSSGWSYEPGLSGASTHFGDDLSEAGDVNGDGYADFLVGASGWQDNQSNEGAAFLFLGSPTTPSLDWEIQGDESSTRLGDSTDGGDVDGDGFSDILIGASHRNTAASIPANEGAVQLFSGSSSGPMPDAASVHADWFQQGPALEGQFGYSVDLTGDIDADGFDDVVVGAPYYEATLPGEGAVFIYTGTPTGPSSSPWFWVPGGQANASFGQAVAIVGDVDGDGYEDILVGAPGMNHSTLGTGGVGAAMLLPGGSAAPTGPVWTFEGAQAGDGVGFSVAGVGDVNLDGYPDVGVGAPMWNTSGTDVGAAWVFHGSSSGLPTPASWDLLGTFNGDQLGYSLDGAGDVNGDLFDDLIVGTPGWNDGFNGAGLAEIYLGSASGLEPSAFWSSTGSGAGREHGHDVAGLGYFTTDAYADVVVGRWHYTGPGADSGQALIYAGAASGMSSSPIITLAGVAAGDEFGAAVDGAGDVDCDGWADLIVGAPGADGGDPDGGQAFIWFGGPDDAGSDWDAWTYQSASWFGWSVAGAGDVNGDGCSDVVVGAPLRDNSGADNGTDDEGMAALFFGNTADAEAESPFAWATRALEPVTLRQIDAGGRSAATTFWTQLNANTPFGRRDVKLQLEIKEAGVPFDGLGLTESSTWIDTDVYGQTAMLLSDALVDGEAYHWRVRLVLRAAEAPPQRYLRWVYGGRGGDHDAVHLHAGCTLDTDGDGDCDDTDIDDDGDGYADAADCAPLDATRYPGAPEQCNGLDDSCAGALNSDEQDVDLDGVMACDGDCDDADPLTYPGAPEACDGVDNDCDGDVSLEVDDDGDGQAECDGDCDDNAFLAWDGFPMELCDGLDNDCDTLTPIDEQDWDADGWRVCEGDCNDNNAGAFPGASEANASVVDLNCDGVFGTPDNDGDGFTVEDGDCDDDEAAIYPGAVEICDSLDNDCVDGLLPGELLDGDGDGSLACADCDDSDPAINPSATETCNGLDDNCDGVMQADEYDADDDGVTECGGDCDDYNPLVHPGQQEICGNGFDDDCVGGVDVDSDVDGDGSGACSGDCDDFSASVNPFAPEICNGVDEDCDTYVDEDFDLDFDGVSTCAGDCLDTNPAVYAGAPAICNDGLDNDCDPATLEGLDADGDGFFACSTDGSPPDCWEGNPTVFPGAVEVCDFVDNDCGGTVDEGFDVDLDGWTSCRGDCDDAEALAYPGLAEICDDGIDNDCAGDGDAVCPGDDDDVVDDDDSGPDDDDTVDDDDSGPDDDDVVDDDDSGPDDDDTVDDDDVVDDDDSGPDDDDSGPDDDDTVDDDDSAADDDDEADDDDSAAGVPVLLPPGCVCGGASITGPGAGGGWLAATLLLAVVGLRRRRSVAIG